MTYPADDPLSRPLAEVDPEIAEVLLGELRRQQETLEMIASENFVPVAVLECQGSVLTNKYAEGYPGRRYYGGCEWVDRSERLAIERAVSLFGAEHANVQPHSGAQANTAVYHALLKPGETIMGLSLAHGGHLSHGMKINVSGRLYDIAAYEVDRESSLIDMDEVARIARERRPTLLLAGWSAYPRQLDFARFREIADEVGALLMVDMAHFAGLVAAGLHPNPVEFGADVVTTTTHKTLGGPRNEPCRPSAAPRPRRRSRGSARNRADADRPTSRQATASGGARGRCGRPRPCRSGSTRDRPRRVLSRTAGRRR